MFKERVRDSFSLSHSSWDYFGEKNRQNRGLLIHQPHLSSHQSSLTRTRLFLSKTFPPPFLTDNNSGKKTMASVSESQVPGVSHFNHMVPKPWFLPNRETDVFPAQEAYFPLCCTFSFLNRCNCLPHPLPHSPPVTLLSQHHLWLRVHLF